ncbi:MAG: SH3 domain-containing protein [Anaerolineaceae bacterium]|nr:SH3 domain-containing protein [Anaerolineaceae bacterium]
MQRRYMTVLCLLVTLMVLAFSTQRGFTQDSSTANCPTLVQQALQALGPNCGGLGRNTACYGYNKVAATFSQAVADDYFTKPSDQAGLSSVASLSTSPLDTQLNEWGVAVMSVQANIPDSLPGQSVRFILLGNSEMQNDVAPPDTQAASQPITVTTTTGSNIRSAPTRNANVLGSVPANTELTADGISDDQQWVRVVFNEAAVGWISRALVTSGSDIDSLPVVNDVPQTPMQAFRLKTGVAGLTCADAPSLLMVQGPKNVQIQITANGVDVQLGSTLVLQTTDKNKFQIATIDGTGRVGNLVIPAGFMTEAPMGDDGNVNGRFGAVLPIPKSELDKLQVLENIPPDILNYEVNVPNNAVVIAPRPTPVPTSATPNTTGSADCANFKATSPLDGLNYGVNTFYWDPAPGATSYRLNVVGFGTKDSSSTNTTFDLFDAGQQFQMSWFVQALVNGQVSCTTPTVTVPREALPPPFSASWQCGPGKDEVTVNYQNVPPGSNAVAIEIYTLELRQEYPVPPRSGSKTFGNFTRSGGRVVASNGQSIDLPNLTCRAG